MSEDTIELSEFILDQDEYDMSSEERVVALIATVYPEVPDVFRNLAGGKLEGRLRELTGPNPEQMKLLIDISRIEGYSWARDIVRDYAGNENDSWRAVALEALAEVEPSARRNLGRLQTAERERIEEQRKSISQHPTVRGCCEGH